MPQRNAVPERPRAALASRHFSAMGRGQKITWLALPCPHGHSVCIGTVSRGKERLEVPGGVPEIQPWAVIGSLYGLGRVASFPWAPVLHL